MAGQTRRAEPSRVPWPVHIAGSGRTSRHPRPRRGVRRRRRSRRRSRGPPSTTRPRPWPLVSRSGGSDRATTSRSLGPTSRHLVTAIQGIWLAGCDDRGAAVADAHGEHRVLRRLDAAPHPPQRLAARARRPRAHAVHRARGRRSADGAPRRHRGRARRRWVPPRGRSRQLRHSPVHERVDIGPQGRGAPAPHGVRQPRRAAPRPPSSTSTTTSSSRGSRSTTTWVWWVCCARR